MQTRTFLICDDNSENFFIGRFTRTENEVKPELWNLPIGDFLPGEGPGISFTRESQ